MNETQSEQVEYQSSGQADRSECLTAFVQNLDQLLGCRSLCLPGAGSVKLATLLLSDNL